ncbi:STAS domain-containing protein [Nonomuraea sp. NPDC050310]|uniref:STAS domain-containing protein n=1 Tax=Nonomuraea sp. NPDC050310 TaxID=3154935 RepID=UPI0033EE5CEA
MDLPHHRGRRREPFSNLLVRVGLYGPCIVLRLGGRLSSDDFPFLREHLDLAISIRHPPWVIVDLSGVTVDEQEGFGVFIDAHDLISRSSGRLVLTGLRTDPPDPRLVVRGSLDEALAELIDEGIRRLQR